MKTKITSSDSRYNQYPCFKRVRQDANDGDYVILFTDHRDGTVVARSQHSTYKIGHTSSTWIEERFDHFCGTIEITD